MFKRLRKAVGSISLTIALILSSMLLQQVKACALEKFYWMNLSNMNSYIIMRLTSKETIL
mgnify:CR=1 FL=1